MIARQLLVTAPITAARRLFRAWHEFWFAPLDPAGLGVLRWLTGGMLIYVHVVWGLRLESFFGMDGLQPAAAVQEFQRDSWANSFWWGIPSESLRTAHWAGLVVAVLFTVGCATPVTSVMALALTISNSNRAPIANFGLDQILALWLLYLLVGGCGARYSVDAWWRRRRGQQAQPNARARLATRLIQLQYVVIYFTAGTSKLQGDAWWDGSAMWRAIANLEYQSIDVTWLVHVPVLLELLTHLTVWWEISFAYLIWQPHWRWPLLAIGAGMHAGIGLFLGMPTFGAIMVFGYFAFVDPDWLRHRLSWRTPQRVTRAVGLCCVSVAMFAAGCANEEDRLAVAQQRAYLHEQAGDFPAATIANFE